MAAVAWQGSGHGGGHATTSISTSLFLSTKQLIDDSAAVKATALREKGARGSFATQLAACCISAVVAINSEIGQRQLERRRMLQACLPACPTAPGADLIVWKIDFNRDRDVLYGGGYGGKEEASSSSNMRPFNY